MATLILLLFMFLWAAFLFWQVSVFVPEDSVYVVERMGRYAKTLKSGRHILMPVHEKIAYKFSPTDGEQDVNLMIWLSCLTKETVPVSGEAKISFHILDVQKAVFDNHIESVVNLVQTIIQREIGKVELDSVKGSFSEINTIVTKEVIQAAESWGIKFLSCEIIKIS